MELVLEILQWKRLLEKEQRVEQLVEEMNGIKLRTIRMRQVDDDNWLKSSEEIERERKEIEREK